MKTIQTIHDFVRDCGSDEAAATKLSTNRQQVGRWKKRGAILVNGKLFAPINRNCAGIDGQFKIEN